MTFTAPWLLWLLPVAALPALLHFLARRRSRELPFSSLELLARLHAKTLPRARLKAWLLVVLRGLVLAGLVLAYAGPILEAPAGASGSGEGEGTDLVLLLDASYSMGLRERGKTRFEIAREAGRELLRRSGPSDRAALVLFSDRLEASPGAAGWQGSREAAQALARARPTHRGTDFAPAFAEASRLHAASGKGRRRVVLLLSDGAAHGIRGAVPRPEEGTLWLGLSWPPAGANPHLVWAGPARESAAASPRLSARAAGLPGPAPAGLQLEVEGRQWTPFAAKPVKGQAAAASPLPPARDPAAPAWSGKVALAADALPADDAYYFSFSHRRAPRALCLFGQPGFLRAPAGGYFLRELFGASGESLVDSSCDFLELGRFSEARLKDYGLVILADFKALPDGLVRELESFVRAGGGLWVLPGAQSQPEDFAPLEALLPARFGPAVPGEASGIAPAEGPEAAFWAQFELSKVELNRYYLLQVRPGARSLFRSAGGYPLLVLGPFGEGRVAVWGGALDASWGNLAVKPVFPSWVKAVLERLSAGPGAATASHDLKVGQSLARSWDAREAAPLRLRLRGPDGRAASLLVRDRKVEHGPIEAPGLYELLDPGTGRRWVHAANLDRSSGESELVPLPSPPWKALRTDALAADFALAVYGREARSPVLAGVALLLACEMVLSLPRAAALALLLVLGLGAPARAQSGDRLAWTQWRLGPDWDPYPEVPGDLMGFLSVVTSVLSAPERRVLSLSDPELYSSPVLVLMGRRAPPRLSAEETARLRAYLSAGGFLWIEDVSGVSRSGFDRWVRETLAAALPEAPLYALGPDHVVYKTFFLLRAPAGRVLVRGQLEGLDWGQRTAVVYSRNDIPGAWAKDALGKALHPCVPGGEAQREAARKTAVNILMYALTGSYKADAVHQPWLLQKLRSQEVQ